MRDQHLAAMPDWRYTRIRDGEKTPFPKNWQTQVLTLDQVDTTNIGLVLGPLSGGVCALDFDGIEAIEHFEKTFPDIDYAQWQTPIWTSGRPYRFQAAFTVPEAYWSVLTRKVKNKLEFRWAGTQSILPPSRITRIGPGLLAPGEEPRQYTWLVEPDQGMMALPEDILCYWLELILGDIPKFQSVERPQPNSIDEEEVNRLLQIIKDKVGSLQGNYDLWYRITNAVCHSVGPTTAELLMKYYWPERKTGEYRTILKSFNSSRSPTIGKLRRLAEEYRNFNQRSTSVFKSVFQRKFKKGY